MDIANKQALNDGSITEGELEDILKEYGTINYEEDGKTIKGITTKEGEYEIGINEIYNGKTTQEVKKLATQAITAQNYGDEVNYSANGVDSWKVFLNDGTNIYIIASDYVPRSGMTLGEGISEGDGKYCINADSRDELVNWLQNDTYWKDYAKTVQGAIAKGGPSLNQFWESYNKKYDTNYTEEIQDLSSHIGYKDTLYFPYKETLENCDGYYLASPRTDDEKGAQAISCTGYVHGPWSRDHNAIRPLVCLPSNIYGTNNEGKWRFTN